ncbi:MAG: tyrosine-type recombinase/integrase [Alistipes sp.]|nr:tyrosine-type recombinase/integrase [Alistipes sp.]
MLDRFTRYLEVQRRFSPLTVRNYTRDVSLFVDWWSRTAGEAFDPRKVEKEHLREWIVHRSDDAHLAAASINRELSSLRAFFRFLHREGLIEVDPARTLNALRTPRRLPSFVPESRMQGIVQECTEQSEEPDFERSRDHLIVLLFYTLGLRLAELVAINIDDFSADMRSLRVVGKGDKERLVPILQPVSEQIVAHCALISRQQICKSGEKALFLTCKGVRISRSTVYRVVQKALSEGGVKGKKSPHVLRHTFATHLMNGGADMREIQELMGHSSLQSTQVYTHNSIARLSEVYASAHPRQRAAELPRQHDDVDE